MSTYYVLMQHQGEDGWCEMSLPHSSRRKLGRELYRGESRMAKRQASWRGLGRDDYVRGPYPAQHRLRVCTLTQEQYLEYMWEMKNNGSPNEPWNAARSNSKRGSKLRKQYRRVLRTVTQRRWTAGKHGPDPTVATTYTFDNGWTLELIWGGELRDANDQRLCYADTAAEWVELNIMLRMAGLPEMDLLDAAFAWQEHTSEPDPMGSPSQYE